jgi:hypothetical protein
MKLERLAWSWWTEIRIGFSSLAISARTSL